MPIKGRRPESASSESEVAVSDIMSVSDVEKIVEKAVKAAITVITQEFQQKVQDLKDYVKHLEERIDKLESAESPQPDVSDLTRQIDAVARENRQYAVAANEAEQFSRRNNIRIKGLTVKKEEDCRQVVTEFVRSKLNSPISHDDIDIAHIIPNRAQSNQSTQMQQNPQERKVVVIAHFRHREVRDRVIRQRKLLKNSPYTVVEDLTSLNLQVINRLNISPEVAKTWSWNGHVFALLHSGQKIKVKPFQSISECEQIS